MGRTCGSHKRGTLSPQTPSSLFWEIRRVGPVQEPWASSGTAVSVGGGGFLRLVSHPELPRSPS